MLAAFKQEGIDFRGILYIGLIWTPTGPSILEFNVRGGDPETQVLLPLLETPLIQILQAVDERRLSSLQINFLPLYAVSVVMAAPGYPDSPQVGIPITVITENLADLNTAVFHGGTCRVGNKCLSKGGRVLSPTAWGENLALVRRKVYRIAEKIVLADLHYRSDIADNVSLR